MYRTSSLSPRRRSIHSSSGMSERNGSTREYISSSLSPPHPSSFSPRFHRLDHDDHRRHHKKNRHYRHEEEEDEDDEDDESDEYDEYDEEELYDKKKKKSSWHHYLDTKEEEDEQVLLHQTVVLKRREKLEIQKEKLAKQRAFIRQEKRTLLLQNALLESEKERFEASLSSDWFCTKAFEGHEHIINIDVGGKLFNASSSLLLKDPNSLLAAFVQETSPLGQDLGCFRLLDQDWWLFRYILNFLRDGTLPHDVKLLRELYIESDFYQLTSLKKAIEKYDLDHLQLQQQRLWEHQHNQRSMTTGRILEANFLYNNNNDTTKTTLLHTMGNKKKETDNSSAKAWWLTPPVWWGNQKTTTGSTTGINFKDKYQKKESDGLKNKDEWWKTSKYKGKDYLQVFQSTIEQQDQTQSKDNTINISKNSMESDLSQDVTNTNSKSSAVSSTPSNSLLLSSTWSSSNLNVNHHPNGSSSY
jgi:hypothetical protein